MYWGIDMSHIEIDSEFKNQYITTCAMWRKFSIDFSSPDFASNALDILEIEQVLNMNVGYQAMFYKKSDGSLVEGTTIPQSEDISQVLMGEAVIRNIPMQAGGLSLMNSATLAALSTLLIITQF